MMFFAYNNGNHYIPFVDYVWTIHNIIMIGLSLVIDTISFGTVPDMERN